MTQILVGIKRNEEPVQERETGTEVELFLALPSQCEHLIICCYMLWESIKFHVDHYCNNHCGAGDFPYIFMTYNCFFSGMNSTKANPSVSCLVNSIRRLLGSLTMLICGVSQRTGATSRSRDQNPDPFRVQLG